MVVADGTGCCPRTERQEIQMAHYEETVQKILEIPKFTTKNTLDHTRDLLRRLGDPQETFQIIHVAGSNGKGSVCAFLASVLKAGGKHVGLFTSPHLVRMEERFRIDGTPCGQSDFLWAYGQVKEAVAAMQREGKPHPTFFEYIFAMGMVVFAKHQVTHVVLETGLGGRLDATNIIARPRLVVITSISLEHTEILGTTIPEIAAEKAGILKKGVPVVYDASEPEAAKTIAGRAAALGCQGYPVNPKKVKIFLNTGKKIAFSYDSGYDVTDIEIPFGAPYQAQNGAVALQAAKCLSDMEGISEEAIKRGMAGVVWNGRMQEVCPGVYLDGAHNIAGVGKFLESVGHITQRPAVLLFSMVKEKDYAHAARLLLRQGDWDEIVITTVPGSRGVESGVLAGIFCKEAKEIGNTARITEIKGTEDAFLYAKAARKQGQVLFCAGSLYLVGAVERMAGGNQDD